MTSSPLFPVTKSFLSQESLAETIGAAYGLTNVRCQLIAAFMRDVYEVSSDEQRYVFFIYRHNQHTSDEIEAEWRFVEYLAANGIPVAPAIGTEEGEYVLAFSAPEGTRYGVLTAFIEGQHLRLILALNIPKICTDELRQALEFRAGVTR